MKTKFIFFTLIFINSFINLNAQSNKYFINEFIDNIIVKEDFDFNEYSKYVHYYNNIDLNDKDNFQKYFGNVKLLTKNSVGILLKHSKGIKIKEVRNDDKNLKEYVDLKGCNFSNYKKFMIYNNDKFVTLVLLNDDNEIVSYFSKLNKKNNKHIPWLLNVNMK